MEGVNGGGGDKQVDQMNELSKTLKDGERILAPTRRPDGTLRKSIRIRAGYVPQDEVAVYQPKGALGFCIRKVELDPKLKKEMESQLLVPPGYDPALDAKPKSKSAKRNERKKEKRLQAAIEKGNNSEDVDVDSDEVQAIRDLGHTSKSSEILTSQMNGMTVSSKPIEMIPPVALVEGSCLVDAAQDIDKKIRALKKKIRLAEAQQQKNEAEKLKAEHLEKMRKLEGWREELKLLELKRGQQEVSS